VSISTSLAIYFVLWWVVLFAVLPWGARSQQDDGEVTRGTEPGAPTMPRVLNKLMWTTIVSAIVFAIGTVVYLQGWVTLEMFRD
jgi:predicted secreted protein